jgi:hypothetical protein
MPLYETRTLVGRDRYLTFLNGTKSASGTGAASGVSGTAASAAVTGPAGAFADVAQGDRFYVSGIATEFTVATKIDSENLTLSAVLGADATNATWRSYRGARVTFDDIVDVEGDFEGGRYLVTYKISAFGP